MLDEAPSLMLEAPQSSRGVKPFARLRRVPFGQP